MEPEGTKPIQATNIVAMEQARYWEAYWANPTDYQLRNQLAEMNSGLIGWTLKKLGRLLDGLSEELREEAKQEAFLGLLHAVELFDPRKGFTFATYAPHWIRQRIDRYLKDASNPIRIPVHLAETPGQIWKAEKAFFVQEGHMPTDEELATFLGLPVEAVTGIRRLSTPMRVVSTNQRVGHSEDGSEIGELFADPNATDPYNELVRFEVPEDVDLVKLKQAFEVIPERSQEMLTLSAHEYTLEEIGEGYGVTRERVRQIISRAIKDIRVYLGIDPDLPIRSVRLADRVEETETVVVHGVTIAGFVERVKEVVEEVRTYGRAKLRLPPSVHIKRRGQKTSQYREPKSTDRRKRTPGVRQPITVRVVTSLSVKQLRVGTPKVEKMPKPVRSKIVRVVSTRLLPPAFSAVSREMSATPAPSLLPNRVLVTDDEFAVAEVAWKRLSYGKWRYLDFEVVAEEVKLPLNKVLLMSCALIAKGVIQQDRPGMYQQGWSHLVITGKGRDRLELDLQLTPDQAPVETEISEIAPEIASMSASQVDDEIARLEGVRNALAERLSQLRDAQSSTTESLQ